MYNQPQFDTNSTYANNPYNDNPKFLKQIFSRPYIIGIIISIGVIIAVMIYQLIQSVSAQGSLIALASNLESFGIDEEIFNSVTQTEILSLIISQGIPILVYCLPFIGFLLIYIKSKNANDSSSPKAGFTLVTVFSIIAIVGIALLISLLLLCIGLIAFVFFAAEAASDYASTTISIEIIFGILMVIALVGMISYVFYLIWIINGLRFCVNAKKAFDGHPLNCKGAKAFGVTSIINVVIIGMSFLTSIMSLPTLIDFVDSTPGIDVVTSFIEFIPPIINLAAQIVLNIFLSILAFSYRKAVNSANYSISYSGANRYTANVSNSTAYYQSTYQGPNLNNTNPPANTQTYQQVGNYQQPQQIPQQIPQQMPQQTQQPVNVATSTQSAVQATAVASAIPVITKSDTIKCGSCGAENDANVKFCVSCGASLTKSQNTLNEEKNTNTAPVCPTCNATVSSNDTFCITCGTKLK